MANQTHMFFLDTLLDTRLATIATINPELAANIVANPEQLNKYRYRPNDLFKEFGLDDGVFHAEYSKRTADLLPKALPSDFLFDLSQIGSQLVQLKSQEPHNVEDIHFVINTYPYTDLTQPEIDRILNAVSSRLQTIINVSHICQSYEQLTPTHIRAARYDAVYFYDMRDWLKCHYHKDRVTEATVELMPGTYVFSTPQFDDLEQLKLASEYQNPNGENISPLIGMQVMFSPFFRLELIPITSMSLFHARNIVKDLSDN